MPVVVAAAVAGPDGGGLPWKASEGCVFFRRDHHREGGDGGERRYVRVGSNGGESVLQRQCNNVTLRVEAVYEAGADMPLLITCCACLVEQDFDDAPSGKTAIPCLNAHAATAGKHRGDGTHTHTKQCYVPPTYFSRTHNPSKHNLAHLNIRSSSDRRRLYTFFLAHGTCRGIGRSAGGRRLWLALFLTRRTVDTGLFFRRQARSAESKAVKLHAVEDFCGNVWQCAANVLTS